MDARELSEELAHLFRLYGARPIYVARSVDGQRFRICQVVCDLESRGGPVVIVVRPDSDDRIER